MTERLEDHHFYCGECLLPFTCPFLVPIHFQLEHEFRCVCDRSFSNRVELLTHMEKVGCRFPFSIEGSKPTATQLSTTKQKSKLTETRRSLADGAFDAVGTLIRKTDHGFSCSVCEKVSMRRFHLWQHVIKSHSTVVTKVASRHLKTVVQKYSAVVGETLACIVCGKPYLKRFNLYEHVCNEHKHEISQITVDSAKVGEQNVEEKSSFTVLCNRFYAKVREGRYRCLICRSSSPSLQGIAKHLRDHGKKLKEYFDKSVIGATLSRQKKTCIRSTRNDLSDKYNVENEKLKTENDDSGLSQKPPASLRPELVVKRPEQELEFLRGYIAEKETFYHCQLCPTKSTRKGYLYHHLATRHDDILGETLSTFRQNEANLFEHKYTSKSIFTPVAHYSGTGTHSLGNVVGNVEFHTNVLTLENNRYKTTGSVVFTENRDQQPQELQSVSDTSFRRLAVSQHSYLEQAVHAGDYGLVRFENTDKLSSAIVHNFPDARPPSFSDGKLSAAAVTSPKRKPILQPACSDSVLASGKFSASGGLSGYAVGSRLSLPLRKKPMLSLLKNREFSSSVTNTASEVSKAFCPKTRTYVCNICSHKLSSKSGWYKHHQQCRIGVKCGKQKRPGKNSASDNQIRLSESALVDSQRGSNPSVLLESASKVKKKVGNDQKMWKCVACQCQFISYSGWHRHFISCIRKRLTVVKKRRAAKPEFEFLRKNVCKKNQRFACRICGLDYAQISKAYRHIRQKHGTVDTAGGDDTDFKLNSVNAHSALNRSPEKVKSEVKSSERKKAGLKIGVVTSGLKNAVDEAVLKRREYVRSQIHEEKERFFCQICFKSFSMYTNASKHINYFHLGAQKAKRPPGKGISPVSHYGMNVASTKVNRPRVKVLYKPKNKNFTNGTKAFVKGTELKTEVGGASVIKSCGLCSKRFLSLHSLTTHIASEHMTIETTPFPCVMCHRNFEKRQYCVRHFVHKHCPSVKSLRVGKKFHCKACDIYFPNKTHRLKHLSEVHADVCEVCSLCKAVFITRNGLQQHIRAIHSAKVSDVAEGQISMDVSQDQGSSRD